MNFTNIIKNSSNGYIGTPNTCESVFQKCINSTKDYLDDSIKQLFFALITYYILLILYKKFKDSLVITIPQIKIRNFVLIHKESLNLIYWFMLVAKFRMEMIILTIGFDKIFGI